MSETEREIEVVAGVIQGVIQKKVDTWQVEVQPDGSQYTKKLWTKDAELVAAMSAKFGQQGAFVCSASYWQGPSGQVRSLWINQEGLESVTVEAPVSDSPATRATPDTGTRAEAQNAVDWDAKERRDYRSRAWAQTISALTHTIKTEEPVADVYRRLYGLQRMIYRDIVRELDPDAFPDDDIPFD